MHNLTEKTADDVILPEELALTDVTMTGGTRNKIAVVLQLHDGSVLDGYLVIGASHRLSDYLNQPKDFIVLTNETQGVQIINRHYIVKASEK